MPVNPQDRHKTAFCPGPGMGLFQFRCMPFGLTGTPKLFSENDESTVRDLGFVTVYIDDILITDTNMFSTLNKCLIDSVRLVLP